MVYQFKILNVTNWGHSSTLIDPQVHIDCYDDLHDELYDEIHNDDMICIMYNMVSLEVLSHLKITNDQGRPKENVVKFLVIIVAILFIYLLKQSHLKVSFRF